MKVRYYFAASLITIMTCSPAYSAGNADTKRAGAEEDTIGEIVVTANKREEKLQDVPAAITALGSQQIQQQGIERVADYIALVPGFAVRDHGAPGYGTVILRGLNTGSFQSTATVAYYFDEMPFTATGSLSYGAFVTPDPDISDIERIEVLKGPQGTLYGASSLGGIVRLISKKPEFDKIGGWVKVDGSTVQGGSEGYGIRASLNVPLVDDQLAVRFSGVARHSPGWVDNVYTGKQNHNDGDTYGGRVDALWKATDRLEFEVAASYQDTNTNGLNYTLAVSDTSEPLYGKNKDSSAWDDGIHAKYTTASGRIEYKTDAGSIISNTSYGKYDVDTFIDFTDAYGYLMTVLVGLPRGTFTTPTYGNLKMEKWTQELRFVSDRLGPVEFIAGAYWTHEKTDFFAQTPAFSLPSLTPLPPPLTYLTNSLTSGTYEELSGFGNLTYYFADNFDITGGIRVSHNKQNYMQSNDKVTVVPSFNRTLPEVTDTSETYLATVRWRPAQNINLFARAASSYRPGGPGVSLDPAAPVTFKPDTVWNYEAGVKASTSDHKLSGTLSIYHIDWNNVQIDQYDSFGVPYTNNGGRAKVDGVEVELAAQPMHGLTIVANAGYTNARIVEANPAAEAATGASPGEQLPLNPKFAGSISADYYFDAGKDVRPTFGATLKYQGKKHSAYPGSPTDPDIIIPDFAAFDLRAGADIGTFNIQLRCENVFNASGIATISSYKVLGNPASPTFISYIRPRTFSITVGKTF
jgi:outer membrane receptor protein involved in Fe transport